MSRIIRGCERLGTGYLGVFYGRCFEHPRRGSGPLPWQRKIADYCPNGLQVEGRPQVMRIVSGVTASQALLDAAVEAQADLVLVHHGYFWKGENPCITGMKQRRLKTLLKHDISLLAYHLPLDLHAEVGNNVQLARQLDITVEGPLDPADLKIVGLVGSSPSRCRRVTSPTACRACWGASRC